jgi:hypothetical protein
METVQDIMNAVVTKDITAEEGQRRVEALIASTRPKGKKLTMRVSEKTGTIVIGLPSGGRYPFSPYVTQLLDLDTAMPELLRFARSNLDTICALDETAAANRAGIAAQLDARLASRKAP